MHIIHNSRGQSAANDPKLSVRSNLISKRDAHDQRNLEAARIMAASPEQHDGIGILWARRVLARLGGCS